MEKKPIKSNLFRFVTLRSPQLADDSKKNLYFVTYPEGREDDSKAHVAARSVTTEEEKVNALKGAYTEDTFTPIESTYQLKEKGTPLFGSYGVLYQFSKWLLRNKYNLSQELVASNLDTIIRSNYAEAFPPVSDIILTTEEEIVVWNNLFYQTINKKSTSVREALIQMLIANHFLKHTNTVPVAVIGQPTTGITFDSDTLSIIANASVVIPKEVLYTKKDINNTTTNSVASSSTTEYIRKVNTVERAQEKISTYENALKEIKRAEVVYKKEEEKAYQEAVAAYEQQVATITSGDPTLVTITDPETGETTQIETYPALEGLQVNYTKSDEFIRVDDETAGKSLDPQNKSYAQLSIETQELINSSEFEIYDTFSEVSTVLQQNINNQLQVISDSTPNTSQTATIGGETISLPNTSTELLRSYGGYVNSIQRGQEFIMMWFTIPNAKSLYVTAANYELTNSVGGDVAFAGTTFGTINRDTGNTLLYVKLFPEGIALSETTYKLKGELTLNNEQIISFDNERDITVYSDVGFLESRQIGGIYEFKTATDSTGDTSGDTSGGDVDSSEGKDTNIYGVSQLGIADFRRVEQEVCCYVPGEVSHIENVMAREYKERATRNLRVSEVTSERSSEREVENLTDTTTTERNELQTEASSIVDQDNSTSVGASASVTGSFPLGNGSYSAGTNVANTSSSAVSNSNLQARNYAQEVTERALERVVEKISTKRTSRILKEFEENNTHGFDNRKGDEHVTGVYRWVDVIYKNTLVNYGKRLMYEFAIPEPAKFYIDKYLNFDEENTNKLISPKMPVNPKKIEAFGLTGGLSEPSQLTKANYQKIASYYNAEVNAYPEDYSISKSYKISITGTRDSQKYASMADEIEIPQGFVCKKAQSTGQMMYHLSGREWPKIIATVGNISKEHLCVADVTNANGGNVKKNDVEYHNFDFSYSDKISVAAMAYDMEQECNVSFALDFELSEEGKKQWQTETFNAIMEAYNERVSEYNDFQNQDVDETGEEKQREFSSQLNRGIEKREIKRTAIELMTSPFEDLSVSESHYGTDATKIEDRKSLEQHASVVKFFEQAFDWEIMAYTFYPYFYKASSSWAESFDYLDGKDPIFKAFLQSGMARAVVPVRPGFEHAVNWFMETGEIWNGESLVTDINDDLYLSIAEELKSTIGEVEGKPWETRVPTSLTVLQASSVVLNEDGLPCSTECNEGNTFLASNVKLGDTSTTSTQDGIDFDIVGETNTIV
ncbi:hypothetical protein [Tenacibaculum sp. 190524A05c]|uniref:hypothetical protein n=1 Tax=Tenacibaculum platacis TaxID=3137852 RepID=UPI0032B25E75